MVFDPAKLRALRESRGWSQPEAARRAGVAFGTYRDIEQGVRADPWYSTVTAIAKVFGVDCGYFSPDLAPGGPADPPAKKPRGRPKKVAGPPDPLPPDPQWTSPHSPNSGPAKKPRKKPAPADDGLPDPDPPDPGRSDAA